MIENDRGYFVIFIAFSVSKKRNESGFLVANLFFVFDYIILYI